MTPAVDDSNGDKFARISPVLLQEFLHALRAERLEVGIRDVERLHRVFSTRRDWTLSAIHETLRLLLARDPNERRTFDRLFKSFFQVSREGGDVAPFDLARALADLRDAAPLEATPQAPQTLVSVQLPPEPRDSKPDPSVKRPRWPSREWQGKLGQFGVLATGLFVLLGIIWWTKLPIPPRPPKSDLALEPAEFDFGSHATGEPTELQLQIHNSSSKDSAEITSLAIAGDYRDFTSDQLDRLVGRKLAPKEVVSFTVSFKPANKGDRRGAVLLNAVSLWPPVMSKLRGTGTLEFTPPPDFVFPPINYPSTDPTGLPTAIRHEFRPLVYSTAWRYRLGGGVTSLCAFAGLAVYVLQYRKPPRDNPFPSRENEGNERFSFASVGGELKPLITPSQAKRLGDQLDFLPTEIDSGKLDAPRSVRETIRAGGLPRLRFLPHKLLRSVVILEDSLAHPDFRTPLVDQLCDRLRTTGVEYSRYRFRGSADRLNGDRGAIVELAELRRERERQAVLLFTDGASFVDDKSLASLEQLADWPRIAWLDLREERFRASSGDVPRAQGLAVFPATSQGLQEAFASFAVGRRTDEGEESPPRPLPIRSRAPRLWAADCACLQPCSPALAHRLREEFHTDLPVSAIQRIYRLDGSMVEAAGIVFDQPTLRLLRQTWLARRSSARQREVLEFIEEQLQKAKPISENPGTPNMAELTWQAALARVRLEIDPNPGQLKELGRLASSPVGRYLEKSLEAFTVSTTDSEKAPLRVAPTNPHARQRLAAIAPEIGIARLDAVPLRRLDKVALATAALGTLLCAGLAWHDWAKPPAAYWNVTGAGAERLVLWETPQGARAPRRVGAWGTGWTAREPVP
ncbi:MAG: hypothetical protein NT069_34435, partial [Planctomycetota bacterium]|nr:hypothetical protein [Planctomycetota bacterium]